MPAPGSFPRGPAVPRRWFTNGFHAASVPPLPMGTFAARRSASFRWCG